MAGSISQDDDAPTWWVGAALSILARGAPQGGGAPRDG
jgi:hypothetical protein